MINGRKIGFFANGTFRLHPIEKACDILAGIGYDAIELDRDWIDRYSGDLPGMIDKIRGSGLVLSEVIIQLDYVLRDAGKRKENIRTTEEYIRLCADAGIRTVNLFTGPCPWIPDRLTVNGNISLGEAWGMAFEAFDRLVPLAESTGTQLAVENVFGMLCHDFLTMSYLINHYDSPALGVNFDPSHDRLAGNTDMEFLVRQWGKERLKHIHLKDAAGSQEPGRVMFPPLGEGYVDWAGFIRGIDAVGYDGVMSVEYEADGHLNRRLGGDWTLAAKESYEVLKSIF